MGWFDERRQKKEAEKALTAELESVFATKNEYALVIFKAYRKMAANLSRFGCGRHGCETVRQHLRRVAASLPIDKKALEDFQAQFELARYSSNVMGEEDRDRAIIALRAVHFSLEKATLSPQQLAMLAAKTGAPDSEDLRSPPGPVPDLLHNMWVLPPPAFSGGKPPENPAAAHVPVAPAEVSGLYKMFGPENPASERPPAESIVEMKLAAAGANWARLGELVEEGAAGPAGKCRLHLDLTFARYMLEFGRALKEAGKAGADPPWDAHRKWLAAAQVLAVAEGRDYLVPDDLKVAMLLGTVSRAFRIAPADALMVMDKVPVSLVDAPIRPFDLPTPAA